MKLLEEKVLKEGIAVNENILKVDGFINHQVDPSLMQAIGEDFAQHFKKGDYQNCYDRKLRHCSSAHDSSSIAGSAFSIKEIAVESTE